MQFCKYVRWLIIPNLVAAAFALLQQTPAIAAGFFPLWQKNPPNATDTVLIYQGGTGRLPWTPAELNPYVSYVDARDGKEKWLFDGFLFIEYHDRNITFSADEGNGKWLPADKNEWGLLLTRVFQPGHGVAALEECCAETEKRLGTPLRSRQVILTLPEPVDNFTNWGDVDGRRLDFSVVADRVAACEWQVTQALAKWRALAPKHLTLAGFYFVPESIGHSNPQMLPVVAQYIHDQGLHFYWIPFWHAKLATNWQAIGFDLASQQPNYFFHPQLPESHLQTTCDFARAHGMGMEMEFDDRLIKEPAVYAPRFDSYLKAFTDSGARDSSSISYYEGGGTILHLARANDKTIHSYYDRIAQWVVDRQGLADGQFSAAKPADQTK
jgi:hypothetical protein